MKAGIKVVAFDAFGTLCRIASPTHPYRLLRNNTRTSRAADLKRRAMAQDLGIEDFGRSLAAPQI